MKGNHPRLAVALTATLLTATVCTAACCHGTMYPVQAAYAGPGPYTTTTGTVPDATGAVIYDLFYPADYAALGFKSPIVTWGNGTGGKPANAAVFLRHLASYGFTVIASTSPCTGTGKEIAAAARYLAAQDSAPASVFHGHLDVTSVAAVGVSQGAGGAVRAAMSNKTLITAVETFSLPNMFWNGFLHLCPASSGTFDPAALTQPIFFVGTHGPFDAIAASPGTERAYFHSTTVHAALGLIMFSGRQLADHPSIATNPGGLLGYATAWLEYRLRGDTTAATAFTGPHPELLSNVNWPGSAVK